MSKIRDQVQPLFGPKLVRNQSGGPAYAYGLRHQLAQLAATGMLGAQPWGEAMEGKLLDIARDLEPEYVAKCALWARKRGHIKDAPALLCAFLAHSAPETFRKAAPLILDNGRMVRGLVGYLRRGGKSLPACARKFVRAWLREQPVHRLVNDSIGSSGGEMSLADILRLVHPKPKDVIQGATFRYLLGKNLDGHEELLPRLIKELRDFQRSPATTPIPNVDFRLLTGMPLTKDQWTSLAIQGGWHMVRGNLNTFARHGVFEDPEIVHRVAQKLSDPDTIRRSRVLPYQLMTTYGYLGADIPAGIRAAIQEAIELAVSNIPPLEGKVYVCPDVSGSMGNAVRVGKGRTSTTCLEIAALTAAAIQRMCPQAKIIPFDDRAFSNFVAGRTVMDTALALQRFRGGGTDCSAPLREIKDNDAKGVGAVILVSDNESWVTNESPGSWRSQQKTEFLCEWERIRKASPQAKLVCIDINPHGDTSQAPDKHSEILNVGGFSDAVFGVVREFLTTGRSWVQMIDAISLDKGLDHEGLED